MTKPRLAALPVVVFDGAAGAALAVQASFGVVFAATAPVRSPPVWVRVAVVPHVGVALSVVAFEVGATAAASAGDVTGDGEGAAAGEALDDAVATEAATVGEALGAAIAGAERVVGEPLGAATTEAAARGEAAAVDNASVVGDPLGAGVDAAEPIACELIGAAAA